MKRIIILSIVFLLFAPVYGQQEKEISLIGTRVIVKGTPLSGTKLPYKLPIEGIVQSYSGGMKITIKPDKGKVVTLFLYLFKYEIFIITNDGTQELFSSTEMYKKERKEKMLKEKEEKEKILQEVLPEGTLPPKWIDEAIKYGLTAKDTPVYWLKGALGIEGYGRIQTPFLRVASAAYDAKKKLMKFSYKDITKEMLAPEISVYVIPRMGSKFSDVHRSAEHVVIRKQGSQNPNEVIQPTKIEKINETFSTAAGGKVIEQAVFATFPLTALKEGYEFYIIYEKGPYGRYSRTFKINKKMLAAIIR
jgi:hypothetical protein